MIGNRMGETSMMMRCRPRIIRALNDTFVDLIRLTTGRKYSKIMQNEQLI
jgi:hypothetical protein